MREREAEQDRRQGEIIVLRTFGFVDNGRDEVFRTEEIKLVINFHITIYILYILPKQQAATGER